MRKAGNMFEIYSGEQKRRIAPGKVSAILITTGAHLSSDAVQLAVEHNIDILFLDKYGNPYGRIWHGRLGSTARIRRRQLQLSLSRDGVRFGLQWIERRLGSQIEMLTNVRNRRPRLSAEITAAVQTLKKSREALQRLSDRSDDCRDTIRGIEGSAERIYWQTVALLLAERFRFKERSRNPAKDEFNCLLNYAYGVLYSLVEKACIIAGLDPYVGFIHTDHYNKTSLVFDVIEAYRIFAEEAVLQLFSKARVKQELFDRYRNGYALNEKGKKALMEHYTPYLDESIRYRSRNIKRRDTIQFDAHRFAQQILKWNPGKEQ